jgi:hypothetical protein
MNAIYAIYRRQPDLLWIAKHMSLLSYSKRSLFSICCRVMLVFAQDSPEHLLAPNVPSPMAGPGSRKPNERRRRNLLLYRQLYAR